MTVLSTYYVKRFVLFAYFFCGKTADFYNRMVRDNLKTAFDNSGMYVREIAAKSGVKKATIDNWMSASKTKEPRAIDLYAVCRAVGITMEQAVDGEDGERYIRECAEKKGWAFAAPERVEDIVANAGKLSDKQLDYVRGLIKTMLDSGDGN
jgi:transcriptional regulator with XRE-family HTH domain